MAARGRRRISRYWSGLDNQQDSRINPGEKSARHDRIGPIVAADCGPYNQTKYCDNSEPELPSEVTWATLRRRPKTTESREVRVPGSSAREIPARAGTP
jgi:hypothetical protein